MEVSFVGEKMEIGGRVDSRLSRLRVRLEFSVIVAIVLVAEGTPWDEVEDQSNEIRDEVMPSQTCI